MSHMAVPFVRSGDQISRSFQGVFAGQENGFVGAVAVFRRRVATKHLHRIERIRTDRR